MNYLSHFFLSVRADEGIHLGNFLGDIVSKSEADGLPTSIMQGIEFHRFIDHFTDNHALVLDGKRLLYGSFGKYASVILDVYFDFFLIEQWSHFSKLPIDHFLGDCYAFIEKNMDQIPSRVVPRVEAMISAKWMNGYLTEKGRLDLFARLAQRAKYDQNFHLAMDIFEEHKVELAQIHKMFFPSLISGCALYFTQK